MRVLVITNDFGPRAGGIESFVQALVERMPHASVVLYTSRQSASDDFDRDFSTRTGAIIVRDKSKILLPTPRVLARAKRMLREYQISTVWFGAAAPLAIMAGALRKAGATRILATTHGHEVWWSRTPVMRSAIRSMGKNVDALTYLGPYTASYLAKAAPEAHLVRLTPGVDVEHFRRTTPHEIRQRMTGPVLVCVSRLVHRKGQDRLIQALPIVRQVFPQASLLFVGAGPREPYLRRSAHSLGVASAVHFTGRVSYQELPSYFCAGDLFVMPTRSRLAGLEVEGLGMVYLEASACELPVVAGRSGGSPDAVIDGKTGIVVDDDVDVIAQTCIDLLAEPSRMAQMGRAGRQWVEQEWQWSTIAAEHQRLLGL